MREKKNELVVILRSCRQRSKISQRDLARTAKVPDSYVRELESGHIPMKKDILFRIAFALFLFKKESLNTIYYHWFVVSVFTVFIYFFG